MNRTKQELREAATHVDYEIQMLKATASLLSSNRGMTSQEKIVRNACLESFVLHVRNLINFLYPPAKARADDVLAEDYLNDVHQWAAKRPAKSRLLQDAETRVNKLAAHLTYSRLRLDKNWKFSHILAELQRVVTCFVDQLPPDRQKWFPSAAWVERNRLEEGRRCAGD